MARRCAALVAYKGQPRWTTGSGCPMGMMAVVSASKHYGVGGFDHLPEDFLDGEGDGF